MADGLYLADGTFRTFSIESLTTELATRQNAGLYLGDVGGWLTQLPDPDPVLRKRAEDAEVLMELAADDQVTTAMLARKYRVQNCQHYCFRPGAPDGKDADAKARLVHERFMADLERTNLRTIISSILDAPFYGMTPLELLWELDGGWWHLRDIVARPYHWFAFDQRNRPLFRGAYGQSCADPVPLPESKFIIAVHQPTYDNPYGLRLLSRCLWPVAFKRGGLQFYAKFVERHGMPWIVGNAPPRAEAGEKREIVAGLSRMVQDCVAVMPAGSDVKFLSAGTTQAQLHEDFLARQDRAISKVLMGQTLTIETDGKNSLAATEAHKGVADDIAEADKAMVADVFNEICWVYARVNVGPDVLAPLFSYEEPEDLLSKADLDLKLKSMGVKWLRPHLEGDYGLKSDEFDLEGEGTPVDELAADKLQPNEKKDKEKDDSAEDAEDAEDEKGKDDGKKKGPDFAAPDDFASAEDAQARLDKAIDALLPEALKASAEFCSQVENAVESAKSFDELQLALADLLTGKVEDDDLAKLMERSMVMAAGFGAAAGKEDADAAS
ncbi:phage portal protein family protein [Bilophila wadsworthia]|uniref:phage portal protein family protein n=1 Tax=Bilophila wadsworthia TaxID=35833 RepID=UPI002672B034|nr:DUF935 family protein [Bilophila wadsworthia]